METNENELRAKTFDGGVTEQQIEKWKAQHRKVSRIDVVDGDETHIGYFKRPDFPTIKAMTAVSKTDEIKAAEVVFDNCWLGGSEWLRKDATLFLAAQQQIGALISGCMSSIKNL